MDSRTQSQQPSHQPSLSRQHVAAVVLSLVLVVLAVVATHGHPSCMTGYLQDHGWHTGSPARYCEAVRALR
jgi:formate hydrogenlyase subunit 4